MFNKKKQAKSTEPEEERIDNVVQPEETDSVIDSASDLK